MMWFAIVMIGFFALLMILFVRNGMVYRRQMELISLTRAAATNDINGLFIGKHYDFGWRYDQLNDVSYNEMVVKFWRPLDSFYPNLDFTNPDVKKEVGSV